MIKNVNIFATMAGNLYRAPIIAKYFLYELYLDTYIWQYFWIFLTIFLIIGRKRIFGSNKRYILFFLFISLSFYFIVYMLTVLSLAYHLEASFHRLLIGLAPAAAFLAFSSGLMEET
jgi:signal transduction histidine kinase